MRLRIAAEEAYHFSLLHERLMSLRGADGTRWTYGSLPAHDGLWTMCEKTAHDIVARMALVPRTLEAGAFVIRKAAVQKYGSGALSRLSSGIAHFARGGWVADAHTNDKPGKPARMTWGKK